MILRQNRRGLLNGNDIVRKIFETSNGTLAVHLCIYQL